MKMLVVCGSGLGSSFMIEMNVKEILKEINAKNVDIDHSDLGSASPDQADVFIVGKDLAGAAQSLGELIVLNNILDKQELKERIVERLEKDSLI
ncbi:PTS sugar transporter subunit IIB [Marinococcus halotolerans]|uniref:PTS sugar transporter subunit IIB n=1 Tax=Marinococcus halotolerans TaxID=301092 RepID=UPI0003B36800|nr:PTS sugar transporter subunit IIB [Marinococcus halotolerans]